MRFAISKEHLLFFRQNDYIEFENLITDEEAHLLAKAVKTTLSHRLNTTPSVLPKLPGQTLFLEGRDLWREDPMIKKIVLRSQLAEIGAALSQKDPLRIAYDQVLISSSYCQKMPLKTLPLSESSSIQGIAIGLSLQLATPTPSLATDFPLAAQQKGSGVFFSTNYPLPLPNTEPPKKGGYHQLLIVYSEKTALYRREENDLHTHALKKFGYEFGDLLQQKTHPIVTTMNCQR